LLHFRSLDIAIAIFDRYIIIRQEEFQLKLLGSSGGHRDEDMENEGEVSADRNTSNKDTLGSSHQPTLPAAAAIATATDRNCDGGGDVVSSLQLVGLSGVEQLKQIINIAAAS